jgi:hypothetical protein
MERPRKVAAAEAVDLNTRVERYSVTPADLAPAVEDVVVLVPPPSVGRAKGDEVRPLERAWEIVREMVRQGRKVRLIAHGATVRSCWPEWVTSAAGLTLSELGAYRSSDFVAATRPLAKAISRWLDDTFEEVAPGLDSGRIFFGSAASRFLQPLFDAVPYIEGLRAATVGRELICVDQGWLGASALGLKDDRRLRPGWGAHVYLAIVWALARAALGQIRNYSRCAPSRARLRALRSPGLRRPTLWLALVPDWVRINRHVIERVALPAMAAGHKVGLLLCTTLLPGERRDGSMGRRSASDLWPGVTPLHSFFDRIPVEQVASPPRGVALARVIIAGAVKSLGVARRLRIAGRYVNFAGIRVDLLDHLGELARLATTDLLQALAANEAFRVTRSRYDFAGADVVFASLSLTEACTSDVLLQGAGARTIDFKHGSGGESWFGQTETTAAVAAVWTATDAWTCRSLGQEAVLLPPLRAASTGEPRREAERILVVSNYVHEGWAASAFPLEPFQLELIDAVSELDHTRTGKFRFRWRPHPDDHEPAIKRALARAPHLELSRGTTLQSDLDWADIVISSPSSTVAEVLAANRPLFLHVPPAFEILPEVDAIDPVRRFFYARDLPSRVLPLITAMQVDLHASLAPEGRARERLFQGPSEDLFRSTP